MSDKLFHQVDDMQVILRCKGGVFKQVWSTLCSIASAFRDSDKFARSGRRSWRKINAALEAIPMAYSPAGDGR